MLILCIEKLSLIPYLQALAYIVKNMCGVGFMWFLSGLLLAVSLSMDALTIGFSYGLRSVKVSVLPKFIISLISFVFTSLAIGIGNIILLVLPQNIAKLIGSIMLVVLGAFIVHKAIGHAPKNDTHDKSLRNLPHSWSFAIKPLRLTIKIIHAPASVNSHEVQPVCVSTKESLYLGIALSIDSFGAGVSSAVSGLNSFFVPFLVGVCQFLFLSLGVIMGAKLSEKSVKSKVNSKNLVALSGIILIILAAIRYFC